MFLVFSKDNPDSLASFETAEEANAYAEALRSTSPNTKFFIKKQLSPSSDWRERERTRFTDGVYKPVPWADRLEDAYPDHFVHVSLKNQRQVAFTPDEVYGADDRQVSLAPGKYLTRFYSNYLSSEQIREFSALLAEVYELRFATTADEIEHVYLNGPSSCMSKSASYYKSPFHPVRVYESPDLALAYLVDTDDNEIVARALTRTDKKVFGRMYGDEYRLEPKLRSLGYEQREDFLVGARLARHPVDDRFVMPYLDWVQCFDDDGDYLTPSHDGDYDGQQTDGLSEGDERCICPCCGERYDEENGCYIENEGNYWCPECASEHAHSCEECGGLFSEELTVISNGDEVCESCLERNYFYCETCGDWHRNRNRAGTDGNGDDICEDCVDDGNLIHVGNYIFLTPDEVFERFEIKEGVIVADSYGNTLGPVLSIDQDGIVEIDEQDDTYPLRELTPITPDIPEEEAA